jgi:TolB-like protein/DNA-binding winged helix-turn-helix (wHTH) protein/tetratricopeptide (TPR) repeat protein
MSDPGAGPVVYEFGDFRLDPRHRVLVRLDGRRIDMTAKAFDALLYLVERAGTVVTRDELMKSLWPRTVVEDNGLTKLIAAVRRAVGPPECIMTLQGRGYQFVADVRIAQEHANAADVESPKESLPSATSNATRPSWTSATAARWFAAVALVAASIGGGAFMLERRNFADATNRVVTLPPIRSIAVLPLDDLSGDSGQDYFADGLTEALITELGQIDALEVRSRTSAMRYKGTDKMLPEIARELGVDALIEGSVLREGDEVRITLKLVHGATDRSVWSRSYERHLRNILALQAEVAQAIATEVQVTMTPELRARLQPPAGSGVQGGGVEPRAYEAYLKGRYIFNGGGGGDDAFRRAIALYQESIRLDPSFALARAAFAEACLQPTIQFVGMFTVDDCERAARQAVALDAQLAEAHAALSSVLQWRWQWTESEAACRRAIELNPNSATAHQQYMSLLRTLMRFDEALAEIRRAEELDRLNLRVKTMVGWPLFDQRRFDEALAQWQEVLAIDPDYGLAQYNRGLVFMFTMPDEVLPAARRAAHSMGESSLGPRGLTAAGYALTGDRQEALAIVTELEAGSNPAAVAWISQVYVMLGDDDRALDALEKSLESRSGLAAAVTSEPSFDSLRSNPRFKAIRREMGLP